MIESKKKNFKTTKLLRELRNPILRIILVWSLFCLNGFMQVCLFFLFLFFGKLIFHLSVLSVWVFWIKVLTYVLSLFKKVLCNFTLVIKTHQTIKILYYQLEFINMLPQSFWVFQRKFIYKEKRGPVTK